MHPDTLVDFHTAPYKDVLQTLHVSRHAAQPADARRARRGGRGARLQIYEVRESVWKSKLYGAFVLNHRVVLDAIDATPARWRGDAGSSPLDRARTAASSPRNDLVKNCRVHPTHWLLSTQAATALSIVGRLTSNVESSTSA